MSLEDLDDVRIRVKKKAKPEWALAPFDPKPRKIMAFDQALTNTGWVLLDQSGPLHVGTITTEMWSGHEGNLRRATSVYDKVQHLLVTYNVDAVVHETPPVGPARRPEASLLSALAVRIAAAKFDLPVTMVAAQKAKHRLTGDANATKPEVRLALKQLFPDLPHPGMRWNEHIRDALALGVVAMEAP